MRSTYYLVKDKDMNIGKYDPQTATTYWRVDKQNNMMENISVTDIYDDGHYDGIGLTTYAYAAYKDPRFIEGIKSCWVKTKRKFLPGYYYKGQRYPGGEPWTPIGISRDHTIYTFISFKLAGMSDEEIWEYAKHMPFNLGIDLGMKMTPSLWLWLRLMSNKWIGKLYYPICYIEILLSTWQNKLLDAITGGFDEALSQDDYYYIENKPKALQFMRDLYYPTYALKLAAFQLWLIPDTKLKAKIKKMALKLVPKYNPLLTMMFGGDVTEEEIINFKSMYGDRFSDEMDPFRTRGMVLKVIDKPEHIVSNAVDKDLLITIYNEYLLNKNK